MHSDPWSQALNSKKSLYLFLVTGIFLASSVSPLSIVIAQGALPVLHPSQVLKSQTPIDHEYFGYRLAIDGDTAVVAGSKKGNKRVSVFRWQQGAWEHVKTVAAEIIPEDGTAPRVAVDGDILLLSEPDHDDTVLCSGEINCDTGLVYVFERNLGGEDNWGLRTTLNGGHKPGASFGNDVQVDGDTVVVSAVSEGEGTVTIQSGRSVQNTLNAGAVYIYERNEGGENQWGLAHRLVADHTVTDAYFGSGIHLVGDVMMFFSAGQVLVYKRGAVTEGKWGLLQEIEYPTSRFPNLAFDGLTAVVSTYDDALEIDRFQFYEPDESGQFRLQKTVELESQGGSSNPTLDHGHMIAKEWGNDAIKARVFQKDVSMGLWELVAAIDGTAIGASEHFVDIDLDSGRALLSTYSDENDKEGEVYFYEIAPPLNSGHMGAFFNPLTSGQGQLVDVEPASQFLFSAWFTFTHDGSDNPLEQQWYTAQGNYAGNKAELTLYESIGGRFNDPQPVETVPVGEVTMSFTSCEGGVMQYSIDTLGISGSFPILRVIPGSGDVCEQQEADRIESVDINAGMDGGWFDPDTSGQGFLIDAHPDPAGGNFVFVAWFTYGDTTASGHRWLTAQGSFEGATAQLDVYETTGGLFDGPLVPVTIPVGMLQIDFADCSTASMFFQLDEGVSGEVNLIRLVPGAEALCKKLEGAD